MPETDEDTAHIAVVVTTYQQRAYLSEALQSITSQTRQASEIVVVDDGSDDPVDDIVSLFPGVKLHTQTNQGPAAARNSGLGITGSPYVAFLDGDDRLLPHALESGLTSLRAHPHAPFTSGASRLISQDSQVVSSSWLPQPAESANLYQQMLRRPYICPPGTVLFRRAAFDLSGTWDEAREMRGVEDWEIYLRLARDAAPACHRELIADYRIHPGQISRNSERMKTNCLDMLKAHGASAASDRETVRAGRAGQRWVRAHFGLKAAQEEFAADKSLGNGLKAGIAMARYAPTRVHDALSLRATPLRSMRPASAQA